MHIQLLLPKYRRLLTATLAATALAAGAVPTASPAGISAPAAQTKSACTGVVLDDEGQPLIGASVMVEGAQKGTTTDVDGRFTLADVKAGATLHVSCVGCQPQTVKWTGSPLSVTLQSSSTMLNEVVVTAMGIQRKESSLTYATQQLKSDDIMRVQDANLANALTGKVSGVNITQSAGGAGGTSKILIRGNKSVMGNNSPLIVVDGIPMTNQAKGGGSKYSDGSGLDYSASSEGGDALSLINPDDIESINVLKGANAAALYGSAAANGVLMITTKKGRQGRINISVNSNVTFERPLCTPALQSVYGSNVSVLQRNDGTVSYNMPLGAWGSKLGSYTAEQLGYPDARLTNTARDAVGDFFGTGVTFNDAVAISGGTELVRSYFSYANSNAKGMVPNNRYNRNTFSFRQNYSLFDRRLNIDVAINYVYAKTANRPGGGTVLNPLYDLYRTPANIDMQYYRNNYCNPNGSWQSAMTSYYGKDGKIHSATADLKGPQQIWAYTSGGANNPYWLTLMNNSQSVEERVYGSGSVSYELLPGLRAQARMNVDRAKANDYAHTYATTMHPTTMVDYGVYGAGNYSSNDWYVDAMLSYNRTFAERYGVSLSGGWVGHTNKTKSQSQTIKATYFLPIVMNSLPTLVNYFEPTACFWTSGNGISHGNGSNWDKGYFITGQFDINDYVFIEGSYREDWYRAFRQFVKRGTPDHYGYWSAGANTLVHRWAKLPSLITHLKLRASYSEVGNSIPNQVFAKVSKNLATGAVSTPAYGYFDNPRPEKSKSLEFGYDVSMFGNRLNWDLTCYDTRLTNSYFLAATTGGKSKPVNTGCIRNRGVESTLSFNLLQDTDWSWNTNFNLAYNANRIEKTFVDEQTGLPSRMEQTIAQGSIVVRYEQGGQFGDMYGLDFVRNADGSIKIDPVTGVPLKSSNDFVYLGNMNSRWNLGWGNTLRWRDLSLYFLINGRLGGKFISLTEAYLDFAGTSQRSADARLRAEAENIVWHSADGRLSKPGMYVDGTLVPIKDYYEMVGGQVMASEYVYDATNFRLGELSLSYRLHDLFGGVVRNVTLSAVGRNLLFLYKRCPSDPDIALSTKNGLDAFDIFNMPSARSFGFNLKFEF